MQIHSFVIDILIFYAYGIKRMRILYKMGSRRLLSLTFESFPELKKAAPRFNTK